MNKKYSVILLSFREDRPYTDEIDEESGFLIYEGHDAAKNHCDNPKTSDQPMFLPSGKLTENGKFLKSILDYKDGKSAPELVKAYEKIKKGIWSDKGYFQLVDAQIVHVNNRNVFRFSLNPIEIGTFKRTTEIPHNRLIPSAVKVEVWRRDHGQCVICGSKKNLHFDHDIPFSEGGSSLTAQNIRVLCLKHNLEKSNNIVGLLPLLIPVGFAAHSLLK